MKTYIGTKKVKAMPMKRLAYNQYRGWTLPIDESPEDDGYLVEYLDGGKPNHPAHKGYISWSPKEQFDAAYRELSHQDDLQIFAAVGGQHFVVIAPRVTLADIEAAIVSEHYFTAAQGVVGEQMSTIPHGSILGQIEPLTQVTFCVLVLRNGTKIVGINYGAIDPAQHSAALGRAEARAHAIDQIWPLMGYALREQLAHGTWIKATPEETTG